MPRRSAPPCAAGNRNGPDAALNVLAVLAALAVATTTTTTVMATVVVVATVVLTAVLLPPRCPGVKAEVVPKTVATEAAATVAAATVAAVVRPTPPFGGTTSTVVSIGRP